MGKENYNEENFITKYHSKEVSLSEHFYTAVFIKEVTPTVQDELLLKFPHLHVGNLKMGWNLIEVDDSGDYTMCYWYDPETLLQDLKQQKEILETLMKEVP